MLGLALGAYTGWRRGGPIDLFGNGLSLILYSMPYFVIGMLLLVVFSSGLHWFPVSGMLKLGAPVQRPVRSDHRLPGPLHPAGHRPSPIGLIGQYSILMRSSVIETLSEDYITTARAKGIKDSRILRTHALPNALLPAVTLIAINLGYVVAGAITVEVVFNWPGLGTLTIEALGARDYPVLQGVVPAPLDHGRRGQPRRRRPVRVPRPEGPLMAAAVDHAPILPRRALAPPAPRRRARSSTSSRGSRPASRASSSWLVFAVLALAPGLFVGPLQTVTTATGAHIEPPSLHELAGHRCARPERPQPDRLGHPGVDGRSASWRRS